MSKLPDDKTVRETETDEGEQDVAVNQRVKEGESSVKTSPCPVTPWFQRPFVKVAGRETAGENETNKQPGCVSEKGRS